jgi:hypothetical protein
VTISLGNWLQLLHNSHSASGFPLVVAGVGLMLFGWRMWKLCVVLSFGLIGAAVTAMFLGPSDDGWMYILAGGAALGLLSYWPVKYALSVLGGLIAAGVVTHSLGGIGLTGATLWSSAAVAFIAGTALACLNRQQVVILVTAFIGAILTISGLAMWVLELPGIYGALRGMAGESAIVAPFVVLVPTVMSCFYQSAEVHRLCTQV